jgi:hypothetical protein
MQERQFGLSLEDLTLWCAGLSRPQVQRWIRRWPVLWPRRRPASPRLLAFGEALRVAERRYREVA